jgi:multimeric flavodoxin WrbA
MKTLLIAMHSMTGGTRQMAEAAARGAGRMGGVRVRLLTASEAGPEDILAAEGYIFATPEMLGSMAGRMKDLFDRSYYQVLGRVEGRPYACAVCAGSDGGNATAQIARIVTGWRLRAVAAPLIVRTQAQSAADILAPKTITTTDLERCAELGATLAAGMAMGVF